MAIDPDVVNHYDPIIKALEARITALEANSSGNTSQWIEGLIDYDTALSSMLDKKTEVERIAALTSLTTFIKGL